MINSLNAERLSRRLRPTLPFFISQSRHFNPAISILPFHSVVMNAFPTRKHLGHEIPPWVRDGEIYFITLCAEKRAARPLTQGTIASDLLASVAYLNDHGQWFARLFLIMPDHVHALISFRADISMSRRVAAWKSYTAKQFGVVWQSRFFDHRLRRDESIDEKAWYIRMNPVRAGLVASPEQWPYVFDGYARLADLQNKTFESRGG